MYIKRLYKTPKKAIGINIHKLFLKKVIKEINIRTSLHKFRKGGTPILIASNRNKNSLIKGIVNKPRFEDNKRVWEFEYNK